jgi:chemotaxis protein CheC
LVGIEQKLTGFFQAKITFLFFSHDSVSLAQGLIGREVIKETGVDMRALQYDAITEIGNIVIASCIQAMSDVLEGKFQLTLPAYAEGQFCDLISFPEKNSQGESYVLILKTQLEAVRRNVSGAIILVISDADLGLLMKKIDTWIEKLSA